MQNNNLFRQIEEIAIDLAENTRLNREIIRQLAEKSVLERISSKKTNPEKGIAFQEIVCDFFEYRNFKVFRQKKTRDLGIDGIIESKLAPFGVLRIGLQAKFKKIGSADVDSFIQALNFAEIKLGVLVCKDSTRISRTFLSSKLDAILLGSGKKPPKVGRIELQPVFVMKFGELLDSFTEEAVSAVNSIYKGEIK